MFYSHTFLARKSPLGTVWIAAHLQHKLRKKHVAETNISASVDCIMFPEVPIALRLSGHLLLGVVRIYSKKVDYLYHYCNEVLTCIRAAYASVQVNLPEDANHAPFHSITLPETFELDALHLDDTIYQTWAPDNHLKSLEEITLTDQIPGEGNPYVTFFIDEDDHLPQDLSSMEVHIGAVPFESGKIPQSSDFGGDPVEQQVTLDPIVNKRDLLMQGVSVSGGESLPSKLHRILPTARSVEEPENVAGITDPSPSICAETNNQNLNGDYLPQDPSDIEFRREAVPFDSGNISELPDFGHDAAEQNEPLDPIMNQKGFLSPVMERVSVSGGENLPPLLHPTPPTTGPVEEPDNFGSRVSFSPALSEMAIQPTPPVEKKKAKSRKRKQLFDESLVFTNEFMKKQLEDTSKLVCTRRKLPVTNLDVWRSRVRRKIEQAFLEPPFSGMCADLQQVYMKPYTASTVSSIATEAVPERRGANTPADMPVSEMEIEHPWFGEDRFDAPLPEFMPSPSGREELMPTPRDAVHECRGANSPADVPISEMEIEHPRFGEDRPDAPLPEFMPSPSGREDFMPIPTEVVPERRGANSPADMPASEMEIKHPWFRQDRSDAPLPEFMPSPSGREEFAPLTDTNLESVSQLGMPQETSVLPTSQMSGYADPAYPEPRTPTEQPSVAGTSVPWTSDLLISAEAEDLSFLEADNSNAQPVRHAENEVDALSVRTRAVAQYLKKQSPTQISEGQQGYMSLNNILEGKTRKQCARMFFETLVLKSYGFIHVQQEEPYGDISLLLTPLLKAKF